MNLSQFKNLKGLRRYGSGYVACCPAHDDSNPSLSVTEKDGKILVYCFAGCSQEAVLSALKTRGVWSSEPQTRTQQHSDDVRRRQNSAKARESWATSQAAAGTMAEAYLNARGITVTLPPSLRFHPQMAGFACRGQSYRCRPPPPQSLAYT